MQTEELHSSICVGTVAFGNYFVLSVGEFDFLINCSILLFSTFQQKGNSSRFDRALFHLRFLTDSFPPLLSFISHAAATFSSTYVQFRPSILFLRPVGFSNLLALVKSDLEKNGNNLALILFDEEVLLFL